MKSGTQLPSTRQKHNVSFIDNLRINSEDCQYSEGKITYVHKDIHEAGTAYRKNEPVSLFVHIPRAIGAVNVDLVLMNDTISDTVNRFHCVWQDFEDDCDIYKASISANALNTGLYFFQF